jgi:L-threonylcarbamoyladenylate synthase
MKNIFCKHTVCSGRKSHHLAAIACTFAKILTMSEFEKDIDHCLTVLHQGGTILYPTDTIWGIGCDATNPQAVQKVYNLKERPGTKSLIVLIADEKDILKYVANPNPLVFDFLKTATRPTTVIYDGAIGLAENLIHEDGSIAIRVVQDKFCRHLLLRFRKPIVSTSANLSGEPAPKIFREILNPICTGVDYIVHYRQDDEKSSESSAVVKFNRDGSKTFIRQ